MELDSLFILIPHPLDADNRDLVRRAYEFAREKHDGQLRNSGVAYFAHVVEVAKHCARLNMDAETIAAALLHDTLEDTNTSEEEIRESFGETICFLVKGVTKLGSVKYRGQERHLESMRKFFVALSEDIRVLVIKLADRLHNVATLEYVAPEKRRRIALETIEVHAALAGRLGMEALKSALEDYAFPFAYPNEYALTKELMASVVPEATSAIEEARKTLAETLTDFGVRAEISSRIKALYSTYRKLTRLDLNVGELYDVVALRVLTDSVGDCYQVLGLVHALWKPIPKRIKDYIAIPKANGYRSLHTTVITPFGIVEIQIRTHAMHAEAELGVASHFLYKEDQHAPHARRSRQWIEELKEIQDAVKNPTQFLDALHTELFRDRIFVFSPKGDVIDLPEGASPIDFAFAVHSEIGAATSSARVNGKIAPLSARLRNGDVVEIITSKHAHPSAKWLEYAKTAAARKKIRNYVAEHGGLLQKFLAKE